MQLGWWLKDWKWPKLIGVWNWEYAQRLGDHPWLRNHRWMGQWEDGKCQMKPEGYIVQRMFDVKSILWWTGKIHERNALPIRVCVTHWYICFGLSTNFLRLAKPSCWHRLRNCCRTLEVSQATNHLSKSSLKTTQQFTRTSCCLLCPAVLTTWRRSG